MNHEPKAMEAEKNLHASVPPALLEKARVQAAREHVSLDELVSEAMERLVNKREFDDVLAFGKRHAKARGLKPSDIAGAVADARTSSKAPVR